MLQRELLRLPAQVPVIRKALPPLVLALALSAPRPARADSMADRAQVVFDEAMALMKNDRAAEACPKFEEAQRIDPGMATEFRLAECYLKLGKTGSAYNLFLKVADEAHAAKNYDREDFAKRRARELAPGLVRLTVVVPPEVSTLDGIWITIDGAPVARLAWGTSMAIDPGDHRLEVGASGKETWRTTVYGIPKLGTTTEVPMLASVTSKSWGTQRTIAVSVAGAGALGIILGSAFGIATFVKTGAAKCTSADPPVCDAEGVQLHRQANTTANVANVAFAVGGAALVAGAVLFFTAPSNKEPSAARLSVGPAVGAGSAGLMLRGAW